MEVWKLLTKDTRSVVLRGDVFLDIRLSLLASNKTPLSRRLAYTHRTRNASAPSRPSRRKIPRRRHRARGSCELFRSVRGRLPARHLCGRLTARRTFRRRRRRFNRRGNPTGLSYYRHTRTTFFAEFTAASPVSARLSTTRGCSSLAAAAARPLRLDFPSRRTPLTRGGGGRRSEHKARTLLLPPTRANVPYATQYVYFVFCVIRTRSRISRRQFTY